ncbi:uncharacterized protein [Typha angustifolia]|uniref:uncharacterized protein n=1 Tax=Typha angustifolia TaxID=59011 RepID=UPI003C2AEDB2
MWRTESPPPPGRRLAEIAGGTAADCTAVCCCCPCAVVDLVVLAVVRLPAGICRRAMRARRKKRKTAEAAKGGGDEAEVDEGVRLHEAVARVSGEARLTRAELYEMEKEMRAKFHGAGFWRSSSQRE